MIYFIGDFSAKYIRKESYTFIVRRRPSACERVKLTVSRYMNYEFIGLPQMGKLIDCQVYICIYIYIYIYIYISVPLTYKLGAPFRTLTITFCTIFSTEKEYKIQRRHAVA
jgi:hypothetical protein